MNRLTLLLLFMPTVAQAQAPEDRELEFWGNLQRQRAAAAAQMIGIQQPVIIAAMRLEGRRLNVWDENELLADEALTLNPDWLGEIRDDTGPPDFRKVDLVSEIKKSEWAYRVIYRDALQKAFDAPKELLDRAAAKNAEVKVSRMMNNPAAYRGKVVRIEGNILKIIVMDPPKDMPMAKIYEAWIQTPGEERPLVAVFSILPAALKPYENEVVKGVTIPAKFQGFFIMRYQYPKTPEDKSILPLLIGQTIEPETPIEDKKSSGFSVPVYVFWIVGGIFVTVMVIVFALNRFYKMGDRKVMERVAQVRAARALEVEDTLFRDHGPSSQLLPERNGSAETPSVESPPKDSRDET